MLTNDENDIFNYNYFLQPNVCRFCWSLDAEKEICEKVTSCEAANLMNVIRDLLDIHLGEIEGPDKICSKCHSQIRSYCEFRTFCQESNRKLQNILEANRILNTEKPLESTAFLKVECEDSLEYDTNLFLEQVEIDYVCDSKTIGVALTEKRDHQKKRGRRKKTDLFCARCSKYFPSKVELSLHSLQHKKHCKRKKPDTFCNICKLDFDSADECKTHKSEAHGIERDSYKCCGCQKSFRTNRLRCRHELHFCKGLKDGYLCSVCDRYLPTRKSYEVHTRDHTHNIVADLPEELFKCGKCEERFKTRDLLTSHHEAVHTMTKKKFVCETCGRSFTRSDYLTKHRLTHTGVKKHKCKYCPFMASQRSSIIIHMRRHTGERPYSCEICSQRCVSSSNLQAHRRRHLGTDKFECTLCGKKFGYKTSLEEHIESAHDRPQSHVCTDCGATYTRVRGLKRHLLAKHGKQAHTSTSTGDSEKNPDLFVKIVNDETLCGIINSESVNKVDIMC